MKSNQELKAEYDQLGKSDYLAMIKFYESNIDAIEAIDITIDNAHYDTKMHWQSEYGMSLVSAGYYSQAIPILKNSIAMFENAPSIESERLYSISYFEHVLWSYGVALWEIKNIPEAKQLFERLTKYYPNNEKYRAWLNGLKTQFLRKVANGVAFLGALLLIGEISIFERMNLDSNLPLFLLEILVVLVYISLELRIYLINKKRRKV